MVNQSINECTGRFSPIGESEGCGLALNCPPYPAVYSARAIVYMITGEDIPECPVDFGTKSFVLPGKQNNRDIDQLNIDFSLEENYPDPFSNYTIIPYMLPEKIQGEIIIKDILGKEIAVFDVYEGNNELKVNTERWNTGMYFYSLNVDGEILFSRKMILSR